MRVLDALCHGLHQSGNLALPFARGFAVVAWHGPAAFGQLPGKTATGGEAHGVVKLAVMFAYVIDG